MKKILLFFSVLLSVSACDFGDTNVDPESLSEVGLNLLLPSAEAQVGFTRGAVAARNVGIVMQYFEGTDAQQLGFTAYDMPSETYNNLWRTGLYGGAMKDLIQIIRETAEEDVNAPYYSGIAKILMVDMLGMATTFFGDVPYSEAFLGEELELTPAYDEQEQIFATMQRLLDEAIVELGTDGGDVLPGADDFIFGGDAESWIRTAHAYKARYFLMLSQRGDNNLASARTSLNSAISSSDEDALHPFAESGTASNPLHQFARDRSGTMVLAEYWLGILDGDPREPLIVSGSNDFAGGFWTSATSPVKLITYTEVKFMEAELDFRAGDADGAEAAMNEAVTNNMTVMGVAAGDISAYVNGLPAVSLETIINEKYKALYPQTIPWADYRRTGFPALTPNPDARLSLTPSGRIPERFIYPVSEFNFNRENVEAASARQDPNGDGLLLDDPMWAFPN